MVDGFNINYYCHGISIANRYKDEVYNERLMLAYLNQLTNELSLNTDLPCYYIDFYEQASMPIMSIKKLIRGNNESISEQQINMELDIEINKLVGILYEQFKVKIASS